MSWVTLQFVSILQRACGHHNRDSALCNNICFNLHVVYMVSYEIHNQNTVATNAKLSSWPKTHSYNKLYLICFIKGLFCEFGRNLIFNIVRWALLYLVIINLIKIMFPAIFYFRPVVRIKSIQQNCLTNSPNQVDKMQQWCYRK